MAFLDNTGLARLWTHITALVGNKVDKEQGKSLIANTEIERLSSVSTGLEVSDNLADLETGVYLTNADQLGGINAEEYVTRDELGSLGGGGGAVLSVNGDTGHVRITAEDLGAITSINGVVPGADGTVELGAENIGGLTVDLNGALDGEAPQINAQLLDGKPAADYALKTGVVTSVNGQTGDVVVTEGGGSIDTSNFYSTSNPPPYPVRSVNGHTGAVNLTFPVTKVNNKTGDVVLQASDVGALPDTYTPPVTRVNGQTGDIWLEAPVISVNGRTGNVDVIPITQDFSYPVSIADQGLQCYLINQYSNSTLPKGNTTQFYVEFNSGYPCPISANIIGSNCWGAQVSFGRYNNNTLCITVTNHGIESMSLNCQFLIWFKPNGATSIVRVHQDY